MFLGYYSTISQIPLSYYPIYGSVGEPAPPLSVTINNNGIESINIFGLLLIA